MKIGVMQGRLVPPIAGHFQCFPRDAWASEFPFAAQAGLDCIEWIYDSYGADVNPIATDAGVAVLKDLFSRHNITVKSICADYFMDYPFLRVGQSQVTKSIEKLGWLLQRAKLIGVERIVLPFVDISEITNEAEIGLVVDILKDVSFAAEHEGIELHLETSLDPVKFASLLDRLPSPLFMVNYDSGNSASLGYSPIEEFAAYGSRIGSVHIKDRRLGGTTVPLGTGDTKFEDLFRALSRIAYQGDIILQVARGTDGDEVAWARKNIQFVNEHLLRAGLPGVMQ